MKSLGSTFGGAAKALSKVVGKKPIIAGIRCVASVSRRINYWVHGTYLNLHWILPPEPEWQDQYTTLHYIWDRYNKPDLAERGCMTLFGIAPDAMVLELCAGDGFFTKHFHSARAKAVVAVDFDPEVVAHARRYNSAPNVSYRVADIRTGLPKGTFDNVIWNGAIEHFAISELDEIMAGIKSRLVKDGLLSGYTVAEMPDVAPLSHHEQKFYSMADLGDLLSRWFANVKIVESRWPPTVHNLYFYASDGVLPFDDQWKRQWLKRASPVHV